MPNKRGGSLFGSIEAGDRRIVYWRRGVVEEADGREMLDYQEIGEITVSGLTTHTYHVRGVGSYPRFGPAARALLRRWRSERAKIAWEMQEVWIAKGLVK